MWEIYISPVKKQTSKSGHTCHQFTSNDCNFILKSQKLIIFFLIESSTCQLSKSDEFFDFYFLNKKLFLQKLFQHFQNFDQNLLKFRFGLDKMCKIMKMIAQKNELDLKNLNPRDFRIFKYRSWFFSISKNYSFSEYLFSFIVSHSRFRPQNSFFLTDSEYLEQGHHFDYFWSNISFKIESYLGFLKFCQKKRDFFFRKLKFFFFSNARALWFQERAWATRRKNEIYHVQTYRMSVKKNIIKITVLNQ